MRSSDTHDGFSAIKWILITLLAVYVLQSIAARIFQVPLFEQLFSLEGAKLLHGFVWTIVTYGALHDISNPFHLIMNGLMIFFIGRYLQHEIGSKKLLEVFLVSIVAGGVVWVLFNFRNAVLIGASGGAFGLLTLYCLRHMEESLTVYLYFIVPITTKPKYILWFAAGLQGFMFLFDELGGTGGNIAYSAHLGGMAGAWLFNRYLLNQTFQPGGAPSMNPPKVRIRRPQAAAQTPRYRVNISSRSDLRAEVDRILDKINSQGFGSLSAEEKKTLDQAREILSK